MTPERKAARAVWRQAKKEREMRKKEKEAKKVRIDNFLKITYDNLTHLKEELPEEAGELKKIIESRLEEIETGLVRYTLKAELAAIEAAVREYLRNSKKVS